MNVDKASSHSLKGIRNPRCELLESIVKRKQHTLIYINKSISSQYCFWCLYIDNISYTSPASKTIIKTPTGPTLSNCCQEMLRHYLINISSVKLLFLYHQWRYCLHVEPLFIEYCYFIRFISGKWNNNGITSSISSIISSITIIISKEWLYIFFSRMYFQKLGNMFFITYTCHLQWMFCYHLKY